MSEQPIVFQATPSRRQITVAVRLVSRRLLNAIRAVSFGVALIGVGLIVLRHGAADPGGQLLFIGLLVGLVTPWLSVVRSVRFNLRMIGRPTWYRLDPEGVRAATDLSEGLIRWVAVTDIDERPGVLILRCGKARFVLLPTHGMAPEQIAVLTDYVRRHLGLSAPPPSWTATPTGTPPPADQPIRPAAP